MLLMELTQEHLKNLRRFSNGQKERGSLVVVEALLLHNQHETYRTSNSKIAELMNGQFSLVFSVDVFYLPESSIELRNQPNSKD